MITKQLLSEENFNLHINSMINEAKSNAPSTFIRLLSLLRATNHGNAIVSAYGTNYQYLAADDSTFQSILYTQAMIYDDNCSCQLNSTCIISASFIEINSTQPITIKGLKMGCTPSESLLASTLECFYDQSCINLIQTMAGYSTYITPIPLNITNSRFLMNITVMNLINDLFIEKWSAIMNYSSYFHKCSPMICSYTYIQQLDSFYTLAYLLGLYGGLTIVLKWISPKIVYFINKIYQRRKKTTNSIKPISAIESETIEIMDANNINNTTASSQSLQTVSTHSKSLFSVSSHYWIFGLIGFILVAIGILIPFIYVFQEKKNRSASTGTISLMIFIIECNDIVRIPDEDIQYLNERLQLKEYMNEEDALNTIAELENFYTAIKLGIKGEPSEMIDKAWHAHILNTPMYFKFSEMVFGKYLHHLPFWSGNIQTSANANLVSPAKSVYNRLEQLGVQYMNKTVWTFRYPKMMFMDD
ncbi:unnamed protein product [Adineta steineri]|uniref:Uncharacterized protein n=1 Tax=Adineta steineri TaxID=433720 RepID=A0A815QMJ0_9BILA|nr:unnamed protein product [Adineta steineri]CAF1634010.1 unnamed protein product [Adineta steineri]